MTRHDAGLSPDQDAGLRLIAALESIAEVQAVLDVRTRQIKEGLSGPEVLYSGTVVLDGNGHKTRRFPQGYAVVMVVAGPNPVTIQGGPQQASTPTSGPGVHIVAAGQTLKVPLSGTDLTLYGTANDAFSVVVFSRLRAVDATPGIVDGGSG